MCSRNKYGILDKCYGEGDLELYCGNTDLIVEGWQSSPLLSLREAARCLNGNQGCTYNCGSGCKGKRCICQQKSVACSSKCHSGKPCGNTSQHKQNIRSKTEPPAKKRKKESIEIVAIISSDEEDEVVPLDMQTWIAELDLNQKDKTELETGEWLSDKHIIAAQNLLGKQFRHIGSLQPPFLEQLNQYKSITSNGVQIVNENNNHWLCVSTISSPPNSIDLYNSLPRKLSYHLSKQCGLLLQSKEKKIVLRSIHRRQ